MRRNLFDIRSRLAAASGGREDVTLVAVTKTLSIDYVEAMLRLGVADIGENRALEMRDKHEAAHQPAKWHMIGHLQRNKVKYIIGFAELIHSLDSLALAAEIDSRALAQGKKQQVLVEVNVARESGKHGVFLEQVPEFVGKLALFDNISVSGLMTMAPLGARAAAAGKVFARLRESFLELNKDFPQLPWRWLSMGMTDDFEAAVGEGSNMVRIGRALFQ